MLVPSFQLQLNNSILTRLATVASYDGKHPSLTCATAAGKIFIHSPHERDENSSLSIRYLNINRNISAITSGRFTTQRPGDILLIGTQTNLLAYDVEKNSDIFYKDVPDGINTMIMGCPTNDGTLTSSVYVGGNCSIQGFDHEANEIFWTVTGDNVSAFAYCDVNNDGKPELLVGSDDYEIRAFQQDEIVLEITENDKIVDLCSVQKNTFGYALQNGTVGVYRGKSRLWRVKSMNVPVALSSYDIDGDGENELVIGWNNGKVEARRIENGEVLCKDHFSSAISAIVQADYRLDGKEEIICCSMDGEIRGYLAAHFDPCGSTMQRNTNADEELISRLSKERNTLSSELKVLEKNLKQSKLGTPHSGPHIPLDTSIIIDLKHNLGKECVDLNVSTNNDTIIKSVIIFDFDGGILNGETRYLCPNTQGKQVRIPLKPSKNLAAEILVKVLVSGRGNLPHSHVFEAKKLVPTFCMFAPIENVTAQAKSYVKMTLPERQLRVLTWIQENFTCHTLTNAITTTQDTLSIDFVCLRDGNHLGLHMVGSELTIKTDNMELAGEIIQNLAQSLQIKELSTIAEFPEVLKAFREIFIKMDEYNTARMQLTADIADQFNVVKTLVIKAEDGRILNNMKQMKKYYSELYTLNTQLIGEYKKRSSNHQALLDVLREVNNMIQIGSKLRVGEAKTHVINECRRAIKTNSVQLLFQIIRYGESTKP